MLIESFLSDREVLYFVKMSGCEACEATAPEVAKFSAKHPNLMVLTIDANGPFPERLGLKVKFTPTFLFVHGSQGVTKAGAMKVADLERWIKSVGGAL